MSDPMKELTVKPVVRPDPIWVCTTCGHEWDDGNRPHCIACGTPYRHVFNMGEPLKGIKMRLGEETTRPPIVVINEFNNHYGDMGSDCLFVKTLRDGGLNNEQIAIVINAVDNTCQECWNRESGCACNDDD